MHKSTRHRTPSFPFSRIESLEQRIAPATFIVTSLDDTGIGTLREVVGKANATEAADVIVFERGLEGNILLASGEIDITEALTIRAGAAWPVTIVALGDHRIFDVADATKPEASVFALGRVALLQGDAGSENGGAIRSQNSVSVSNCTFAGHVAAEGGAIYVKAAVGKAAVNIVNSDFSSNIAKTGRGGAVQHLGSGATIIKNTTFSSNTAVAGGAIAVEGHDGSAFSVTNSVIDRNTATTGSGGGIDCVVNGVIRIAGTKLYNNIAGTFGGAVRVGASGASENVAEITLTDLVVWRNSAVSGGGGLSIYGDGRRILVADSEIASNLCARGGETFGGGLHVQAPYDTVKFGTITIARSEILANEAQVGGGASIEHVNARIVSSKILTNDAVNTGLGSFGGGIAYYADASSKAFLSVESSTFTGNSVEAGEGGGLRAQSGHASIVNTKFMDNTAPSGSGGGAYVAAGPYEHSRFQLRGSLFSGNHAEFGGGLHYSENSQFSEGYSQIVSIKTSQFIRNYADLGAGGGMQLETNGTTTVSDCKILDNFCMDDGGGLYMVSATPVTLSNVTVAGNVATSRGGGARVIGLDPYDGSPVRFTFANSKVEGNRSLGEGGAISADRATIVLTDSAVTGNVAFTEGGFHLVSSKVIRLGATIVSGNSSLMGKQP